jgi:predicted MFS family arabinose efflux permease
MVAAIQLAITLGASLGGVLLDASGYSAAFVASAAILAASAALAGLAARSAAAAARRPGAPRPRP